ncbi:MAG: DUF6587 family protein [Sphingomonadaceae bacterium]
MSSPLWQQVIVAVIVAAAALHAGSKYLPAAWRRQLVFWLTRRGYDQNRVAALLHSKSSCGDGCASCGSCASSASAPAAASSDVAPSQRVIPLHVQR